MPPCKYPLTITLSFNNLSTRKGEKVGKIESISSEDSYRRHTLNVKNNTDAIIVKKINVVTCMMLIS